MQVPPVQAPVPLGATLAANPRLSQWLEFVPDGQVLLRVGKAELGQGIITALIQIAAEELDVDWRRVVPVPVSTTNSPDEGFTAGSRSVMDSGAAVRAVCADVRRRLLALAAERTGCTATSLSVVDGTVVDAQGASRTNWWELARPGLLDVDVDGSVEPKPVELHATVGRDVPRVDLRDKFSGQPRFIQDLVLPGLLYGRVVRPPSPGAQLRSVDDHDVLAFPGVVQLVREGNFLGVIATREEEAVRAAERLRADSRWEEVGQLPDQTRLTDHICSLPTEDVAIARNVDLAAVARVANTARFTYTRPYIAHASIAPGCGVARWQGEQLQVWTHSQGVYPLRRAIAAACGVNVGNITVQHVESAGCYGHNSADDVAYDAVLLAARVPGHPVQVVWSRDDEFAWEPYGPAAVAQLTIGLDQAGDIVQWRQDTRSGGHDARPGYLGSPGLLGAWHSAGAEPLPAGDYALAVGGGVGRNGIPGYQIADLEVIARRVLRMPLRTSSLRGLGATMNVFAIESAMDELAALAGVDPVEYRLRHLADERARTVLETVVRNAGWARRGQQDSVGWGVGYARYKNICGYCAVVARIEAIAEVRVRELFVVVDAGQVINPDGLINQVEGGAIQATSWTLREQVSFDGRAVTSRDWESYPVLRFSETPRVQVDLVTRPNEPALGVGEVAGGPVTAAIANALYDAIGVRMRHLPLTTHQIAAAIAQG